jgi:solute carrier family 38 (sodium-coupled neutral amino acid transporter), member 11
MAATAIGGGIISVPFVFEIVGYGLGYALFTIGCLSSIWSCLLLAKIATTHNLKNFDQIVKKAGGRPCQKFLSTIILIYMLGGCVGLSILLSTLAAYLAVNCGVDVEFTKTMTFRSMVNIPAGYLILMPLSLLRDMSALSFAAILSILAITYVTILFLCELPYYHNEYKPIADVRIAVVDWNLLPAIAIVCYAYTCQLQLFPIYSELVSPSYPRLKKVILRTLLVTWAFLLSVCSACYFSTFNYTTPIVISRIPLPGFDPDYPVLIAAVVLFLVIFAAYPMNYNPWRNQFLIVLMK